jgi:hypothetical protein
MLCIAYSLPHKTATHLKAYVFFVVVFFGAPKSISYFIATVSECDGGNRTRNIAVFTWRLKPLSYSRHPFESLCCNYEEFPRC